MAVPIVDVDEVVAGLTAAGAGRGGLVAVTAACGGDAAVEVGLAADGVKLTAGPVPSQLLGRVEQELRPRWVWWSNATAALLAGVGVRVATCWDLSAVHRLLFGGWQADPAAIWAALHGLAEDAIPSVGQLDLLTDLGEDDGDQDNPVRPDGYLRPEWVSGGSARSPDRLTRWAATALAAAHRQRELLSRLRVDGNPLATAWSESAAELLCSELATNGLPVDRDRAEQLISSVVGPRPHSADDTSMLRARRDAGVLQHVGGPDGVDLRNPAQVRAMLAGLGFEVPDTRSSRLEALRGAHPVIEALLAWRKAERIATTYGYDWLDTHVGPDGRLCGAWSGSDGAAGRMSAQAGLHNLPAELRPAVAAETGHVFVRADLGQIEPRILAAVSGDPALANASLEDDLYTPVAARLGVERAIAKVAVLAAMYGQTSGTAGQALAGLQAAYPTAMRYLRGAYDAGRAGHAVRTYGGRLIRMPALPDGLEEAQARSAAAARGRFARNAVIQGAAAEFFKAWAVTIRTRGTRLHAQIVLCLHDELLLHTPAQHGAAMARLLRDCLAETAQRWAPQAPQRSVLFVADISIIDRWSDAKTANLRPAAPP